MADGRVSIRDLRLAVQDAQRGRDALERRVAQLERADRFDRIVRNHEDSFSVASNSFAVFFVPWYGHDIAAVTADARHHLSVPFNGKIVEVRIICSQGLGDTTLQWQTPAGVAIEPSAEGEGTATVDLSTSWLVIPFDLDVEDEQDVALSISLSAETPPWIMSGYVVFTPRDDVGRDDTEQDVGVPVRPFPTFP